MKEWTLFKKAALTAAVCLALTQSVWAMPTGGVVESGNVSGFAANPASGATFTANGNSIINWDAFGIAAGEILNFNTANGALLNRVTGNLRSDIFGTLTQTGAYPMFLVNPNGILVGNGATINASNIVLSTLEMANDDFLNGSYKFATPSGKTIAAPITVNGANTTLNNSGSINLYGGTVEIADGVTFAATGNDTSLKIYAAPEFDGNYAHNKGAENTISIANSKLAADQIRIDGGAVSVSNSSDIKVTGVGDISSPVSGIWGKKSVSVSDSNIEAKGRFQFIGDKVALENATITSPDVFVSVGDSEHGVYTATKDHLISVKNSTIAAPYSAGYDGTSYRSDGGITMMGGAIDIEDSALSGGTDLLAYAQNTKLGGGNRYGGFATPSANADNKVTISNSNISGGEATIAGGTVALDNAKIDGGKIMAYASLDAQNNSETWTAAPENTVTIANGSELKEVNTIFGGSVSVKDSSVKSDASAIGLYAGNKYQGYAPANENIEEANRISIDNSKLMTGGKGVNVGLDAGINVVGGSVAVSNGSLLQADNLGSAQLKATAGELSFRDSNMRVRGLSLKSPRVTLDNADIQIADSITISDSGAVDHYRELPRSNRISFNKTNLHVLGREFGDDGFVGNSGNVIFFGKTFEAKDSTVSTSGTAEIYADSAITLNNTNLNADYGMYLTGGKVDIAHSRLTSPVDNFRNSNLVIKAEETNVSKPYSTNKMGGHSLTLTDTTVDSGQDIVIEAGKVVLDGSTLKSHEETRILAAESMTGSMETTKTITTGADSTVEIKGGSTVNAEEEIVIGGREVSVTGGSTVSAGTQLSVGAGIAGTIQDYVITMTGTPGKISVSTDSKLLQNGADVTDTIATNRIGPTPTPTPNPNPAPTPEIPTAKTLAENVENGKTAMSAVLANNITVEARKSGAKMLIESINRSDASGAVKSAKTTGVLLAILEDESLTDTEKVSLQREIVQTFHPTQIANAETNHTIENTAQTGTSAATGDNQPQNTKRTFPAEEMPIIKGV